MELAKLTALLKKIVKDENKKIVTAGTIFAISVGAALCFLNYFSDGDTIKGLFSESKDFIKKIIKTVK